MSDDDYAQELAALLIADIRTSGARTRAEIKEAFRVSLRSLIGDGEVPARIAVLMPTEVERWPRIVVTKRRASDA